MFILADNLTLSEINLDKYDVISIINKKGNNRLGIPEGINNLTNFVPNSAHDIPSIYINVNNANIPVIVMEDVIIGI